MRHLLLPFTHGIDGPAITHALSLAKHRQATLVLLSLLRPRPHGQSGKQAVRWEDIQQAADFLVFTQQKAARMGVSLQHVELRTPHPVQSIRALAREMDCEGILLFVRRGEGVLLSTHEVKQLLEDLQDPLYLANLPVSNPWLSLLGWCSGCFRKRGAGWASFFCTQEDEHAEGSRREMLTYTSRRKPPLTGYLLSFMLIAQRRHHPEHGERT